MKKNTNFFERISQIIDYYDIKSLNSFAIDYLKYNSSEKINRLKKENTNPSYEILCDIANKFEEIDANWLLLGAGSMLKEKTNTHKPRNIILDQISFDNFLERYEKLAFENGRLTAQLSNKRNKPKKGSDIITPNS